MIKAEERYLLLQAGFTERQINTQIQKFYNLFRVAPMPQMNKPWVDLTAGQIVTQHLCYDPLLCITYQIFGNRPNVEFTFDNETGKLKHAEAI